MKTFYRNCAGKATPARVQRCIENDEGKRVVMTWGMPRDSGGKLSAG